MSSVNMQQENGTHLIKYLKTSLSSNDTWSSNVSVAAVLL